MDWTRLQTAIAELRVSCLPPLASVIASNKDKLKDFDDFATVTYALVIDALKKFDAIMDGQAPPLAKEERYNFIVAGVGAIVMSFNATLETDYPNVLGIIFTEDSGEDPTIHALVRKQLPGMHDCLRKAIIPILVIELTGENEAGEKTFDVKAFKVYPQLDDDEELGP